MIVDKVLSATNPTLPNPGSKPGHRCGKQATNRVSEVGTDRSVRRLLVTASVVPSSPILAILMK
jgi:hypothetical protein